jgi:hypothetical protein
VPKQGCRQKAWELYVNLYSQGLGKGFAEGGGSKTGIGPCRLVIIWTYKTRSAFPTKAQNC